MEQGHESNQDVEVPKGYLRLHYLRPADHKYYNWGLYLWGGGYDKQMNWGAPLSIDGIDSYGAYWDIPYQEKGAIKFIIHNDRFRVSDISGEYLESMSGKEIWVVSGRKEIYFTLEEAIESTNLKMIPPIPTNYIRLHYYRPNNDYQGCQLKYWREDKEDDLIREEGKMIPIGEGICGVYWDIPYRPCDDKLRFVICEAENKMIEQEHEYDDLNKQQEIWMMAGDQNEYYSGLEVLERSKNKIEEAMIIGKNEIEVYFKDPVDHPIMIKENFKTLPLAKLDDSQKPTYRLTTQQELDYNKIYTIQAGQLETQAILSPEIIESNLVYNDQLGVFYKPEITEFRLWAPSANRVELELFEDGFADYPTRSIPLAKVENGVWETQVKEDLVGQFYNYKVTNGNQTKRILDPYAKSMAGFDMSKDSTGKGAIVDLSQTDPQGWSNDDYIKLERQQDAVIYEISIRDFTIADNSQVVAEKKGTYLGFIEKIPHLKELGITHVQLMPILNFYYGNEYNRGYEASGDDVDGNYNYNWGYDPHNYFTPEGWYSLNPDKPHQRIREVKRLIKELHKAGIGVILDVVYNHTAEVEIFENIVPYYYYRRHEKISLTNGSGCGNDTASERKMMRKLMIDSTTYWTKEYHVDGFRFDLMGLHDEETMTKLVNDIKGINPSALIYGEGWNLGTLPTSQKYVKADGEKRSLLEVEKGAGVFNDTIRDAIKQTYFGAPLKEGGFIQQEVDKQDLIRAGIIAGMVDYQTDLPIATDPYHRFADDPQEVINYVTCHDGYTLWDKIVGSTPAATYKERKKMQKLATAIILTAQGIPFLHGGSEMLRTKPNPEDDAAFVANSYNSSDYTNQIDWSRKEKHQDIFAYYQGLIKLRLSHEAFRLDTMEEIEECLTFLPVASDYLVSFKLEYPKDKWEKIIVVYNANREVKKINLEEINSHWKVAVDDKRAGVREINRSKVEIKGSQLKVPAISTVVIYKEES
ncbi:pullulanase, type I [Halobacteroides halobius DSM 5150]|uniref:pullulanase n=1 Tax=Halobacteroides halobius (strain ATCC 35273 / DSM 5150 / MD-1) TaxID=748449 RepID=L0K8I0_HALHC|nr:type I pullulanase [Halobacteroides halobius]AGB41597.1 pullulanase, type I [Halobacteroides halobius DSM 5150]